MKITVPERGEYELGSREVKFNIYKRNLTVKPNDITITAGQTLPAYSLYDVRTQRVMFMTYHLSKYVISYEEWKNLFQDVKEDNWYYLAVKFIAERSLMSGTSEEAFSPNYFTTRAHSLQNGRNAEAEGQGQFVCGYLGRHVLYRRRKIGRVCRHSKRNRC